MKKPISTRRALAGAAIAAAAGAALALPSTGMGGVAAIQDDVLTTAPITEIPQRLQLVKNTQAKVARFDILWSFVATREPVDPTNPNDPAYDWSRIDQVLTGFDAANITPIVSTYSTPTFAVAGRNTKFPSAYNPNAPIPQAFGAFMKAVATRYSGNFTTATAAEAPPRAPLRDLERAQPQELLPLQQPQQPGQVQGPGEAGLHRTSRPPTRTPSSSPAWAGRAAAAATATSAPRTWMNRLVSDKSVKFDAYSQHIYPSQAPKFTSRGVREGVPDLGQPRRHLQGARQEAEGHEAVRHRGRLHDRVDALPHGQGHAVGAEQVPEADLQPAAGQEPADGGGGLVQPRRTTRTGPAGCCGPTAARSRATTRSCPTRGARSRAT